MGQTIQATANSDRPGFVIDKYKEGSEEGVEVMELYHAMGRPYQHYIQDSMLARCHTFAIAACTDRVINKALGIRCKRASISFAGACSHYTTSRQQELVETFCKSIQDSIDKNPEGATVAGIACEDSLAFGTDREREEFAWSYVARLVGSFSF
jgi:hypothetical protein